MCHTKGRTWAETEEEQQLLNGRSRWREGVRCKVKVKVKISLFQAVEAHRVARG
jgi:hypothetical protein